MIPSSPMAQRSGIHVEIPHVGLKPEVFSNRVPHTPSILRNFAEGMNNSFSMAPTIAKIHDQQLTPNELRVEVHNANKMGYPLNADGTPNFDKRPSARVHLSVTEYNPETNTYDHTPKANAIGMQRIQNMTTGQTHMNAWRASEFLKNGQGIEPDATLSLDA